jgi:hypothetical protein
MIYRLDVLGLIPANFFSGQPLRSEIIRYRMFPGILRQEGEPGDKGPPTELEIWPLLLVVVTGHNTNKFICTRIHCLI